MESLLVVVAAVSLALAAIMSTVAWRLLRDNHHRTTTRAEALVALLQSSGNFHKSPTSSEESAKLVARPADPAAAMPAPPEADTAEAMPVATPAAKPAEARPAAIAAAKPEPPREPEPTPARKRRHVPAAVDGPLHDTPVLAGSDPDGESSWDRSFRPVGRGEMPSLDADDAQPVATSAMFDAVPPKQMPIGRWLALAAAGLVIVIGAGTVYALNTGTWLSSFTSAGDRDEMVASSTKQPLELLSLKHHTDETGAFVVTGLVQNPVEGGALRGVVAMVYLFDQQGRYFASGRARLDAGTLGAGEESPFVVKIPRAGTVGRYRVGFRLDDGGVVAHVDRRGQIPAGTSGDTIDDEPGPSVVTPAATPRRREG
jgi:hypothetical protein